MEFFLSKEDRQMIEDTKLELRGEVNRLRNKINNFIGIEILTFFLTVILFHYQFVVLGNPTTSIIMTSCSVLFQLILIQATRVALYNWKSNKSMLIAYELTPEEFNRRFQFFLENSK